jgi:hypothetical protein
VTNESKKEQETHGQATQHDCLPTAQIESEKVRGEENIVLYWADYMYRAAKAG